MLDNHQLTPESGCTCDVCAAPRFDKEAEFRKHIQPLMEALQEKCESLGIPLVAASCYGLKLIDGDPALGVFSCGGGTKDGWAPQSFKMARGVIEKNGPPDMLSDVPVSVSLIQGGTLMDVIDALAKKFGEHKE